MFDAVHVAAGALIRDGRVLLAQRPAGKDLAGLWEFPGGKLEPGETAAAALRRELREELGVEIDLARTSALIRIPWRYAHKHIVLHVQRCDAFAGEPRSLEGQALRWVPIDELDRRAMPAADHPAIAALQLPSRYLITPEPGEDEAAFLRTLAAALERGVRLVQLRAKQRDETSLRRLARSARALVTAAGGRLLINAHWALAQELELDGVHLTAAQLRTLATRPLAADRWVAASCHDADDIAAAVSLGVDFIVLGPVAATPSHTDATPMGWDVFENLLQDCPLPAFALGGMSEDDLPTAIARGAQGIAAISALWK